MTDYGHPLRFGTFITPVNDPPIQAVDLAVLSEDLGFDLVTFQDHPYQPRFHDTWTLLTWVAARTSRIQISANVINLPLRQPGVLARASASLDLLSQGRVNLGLGAGGFWDAIEAMGGPRRTPGQAVTALGEAIDVIRGIWDVSDRSPLRAGGEFYRVDGAKRGPEPSRPIPIWLGAYKPRMLRLVGTKADGWLPSLGMTTVAALAEGNDRIDQAATAAGRDPKQVTRLVNVAAEESVDDVVALAVEHGFSVFIVASDDPAELRRWSAQVAPEVRRRVEEARSARACYPPVSSQPRYPATAQARTYPCSMSR